MIMEQGHRKFFNLPTRPPAENSQHATSSVEVEEKKEDKSNLLQYINDNIIGSDRIFGGPFGDRRVTYCDYTASGRSLSFIEDYILREVLPDYGNTHTTSTMTALQTTLFRHEARDIFRNACRASDHDAVIFVGSGTTGAVHKLIHNLDLEGKDPIVFVGPFEHHSNLLPWRHIGAKCVRIACTSEGLVDFDHLEAELKNYASSAQPLIGCFSAASNITGVLTDTNRLAILLHRYGAKAFFDYASAAPYITIDMNPVIGGPDQSLVYKDAVFFSMHKFVGGVQTPGVLIAKRALFNSAIMPHQAGGGTVFFVRRDNQLYLQDVENREEGGTPAIVESIRAGLVMQLKMAVGVEDIAAKEEEYCRLARGLWSDVPELRLLGGFGPRRLPIFSFVVRAGPAGRLLHHSFVAALLNDIFGIQSRPGCACAGPYALDLLGIDEAVARSFEESLVGSGLEQFVRSKYFQFPHREVLRPGFSRISLPFFLPRPAAEFVVRAVRWVAQKGWRLLPLYRFHPETGEWRHRGEDPLRGRKWLGFVSYSGGRMGWKVPKHEERGSEPAGYEAYFAAADALLNSAARPRPEQLPDDRAVFDESCRHLLWFLLPSEAAAMATGEDVSISFPTPIMPGSILPCSGGSGDLTALKDEEMEERRPETARTVPSLAPSCPAPASGNVLDNPNRKPKKRKKDSKFRTLWRSPPKEIFKPFLQAMEEYEMIQPGDRVVVGLSGGKDSLSLLHTLRQYQQYLKSVKKINFDLAGATVDPETGAYDPSPLISYMAELQIPYFFEKQKILETAKQLPYECESICAFCSRMKRGRLYACLRREGYNVLALGHHLDDLTESFLMSCFHNGSLRTLKANYTVKEGDLRVIRPLIYVREKHTRAFADSSNLPVIPENCPGCFEAPKERFRLKQVMAEQEVLHPHVYNSLAKALRPLLALKRAEALCAKDKEEEDEEAAEDCLDGTCPVKKA